MTKPIRRRQFDSDDLIATFSIRLPAHDKRILELKASRDGITLSRLVAEFLSPHLRGLRVVQPDDERLAS